MNGLRSILLLLVPLCCSAPGQDLVCCGTDEVFVIDPARGGRKKWSWRAADSAAIPEALRDRFRTTDECKPYSGGLLLVTASSGGVALLEREGKKCRFLAVSRNAHSACLLPDGGLVVASSYGGDQLEFFRLNGAKRPAEPVQRVALHGAHGVAWDGKRKRLWALGGEELLELAPGEQGRWRVAARRPLPSSGGHDLSEMHDGVNLHVTTDTQVLVYDRNNATFAAHPALGGRKKVKSVDLHPGTKRTVFQQATPDQWWSDMVRFVDREPLRLDGERLYKVRWDVQTDRP